MCRHKSPWMSYPSSPHVHSLCLVHVQTQVALCERAVMMENLSIITRCESEYTFMCIYDAARGGGLGSRPIFKKFHETYAPS